MNHERLTWSSGRTSRRAAGWAVSRYSCWWTAARRRRRIRHTPVRHHPLGYLFYIGCTRDVWTHRIDVAHATRQDDQIRYANTTVASWPTSPHAAIATGSCATRLRCELHQHFDNNN